MGRVASYRCAGVGKDLARWRKCQDDPHLIEDAQRGFVDHAYFIIRENGQVDHFISPASLPLLLQAKAFAHSLYGR